MPSCVSCRVAFWVCNDACAGRLKKKIKKKRTERYFFFASHAVPQHSHLHISGMAPLRSRYRPTISHGLEIMFKPTAISPSPASIFRIFLHMHPIKFPPSDFQAHFRGRHRSSLPSACRLMAFHWTTASARKLLAAEGRTCDGFPIRASAHFCRSKNRAVQSIRFCGSCPLFRLGRKWAGFGHQPFTNPRPKPILFALCVKGPLFAFSKKWDAFRHGFVSHGPLKYICLSLRAFLQPSLSGTRSTSKRKSQPRRRSQSQSRQQTSAAAQCPKARPRLLP